MFELEENPLYSRDWNEEENLFIESVYDPFAERQALLNGSASKPSTDNLYVSERPSKKSVASNRQNSMGKGISLAVDLNNIQNNLYQPKRTDVLPDFGKKRAKAANHSQLLSQHSLENSYLYTRENLLQKLTGPAAANSARKRNSIRNNSFTHPDNNYLNNSLVKAELNRLKSNRESRGSLSIKSGSGRTPASANSPSINFGKIEVLPSLNFSKKQMPLDDLVRMFAETKIQGPLKTLNLSENGINDLGLKKILKSLVDLAFLELRLEHNNLETHALDYLISFSNYNANVKSIVLTGNMGIANHNENALLKIEKLQQKGIQVVV